MKKKLLLGVLVFVALFTITGCDSKKSNKWEYSKEDFDSFNNAFSDKSLNQEDSDIDIIYVHDIKLNDNINKDDVLIFNYDNLEQNIDYENKYVSYDLIKKYQINVDKIDITSAPDTLRVYFYGEDDLFINYGVLINKDATKDHKYIITKTQEEYLGDDSDIELKKWTFAPLFSYLDDHDIPMEKLIEDGVINEAVAEGLANNNANLLISNIGRLCDYLGVDIKDIVKFDASGAYGIAHEIDWNTETVKKKNFEYKGYINFNPLRAYFRANNMSQGSLLHAGLLRPYEITRISCNHNFAIKFIMVLCERFQIDVSNVIGFVKIN